MGSKVEMVDFENSEATKEALLDNGDSEASDTSSKLEQKSKQSVRGEWENRTQFLLAIIGYTVGIGSIWRFPLLCARNGGGSFLVPFFFFMATCGYPLYYIEVCIGQFCGKSAGLAFEFVPLFKGLGFLMVAISFNILWYYVSIMGWIQYYFVCSFASSLPWSTCGNWWNTDKCREMIGSSAANGNASWSNGTNLTDLTVTTLSNLTSDVTSKDFVSPAMEFWERNVLRTSGGLEEMGHIQWHLVLSNFIGWALIVASLIKGVQSLGKVVYVTATAPYILLTILLIRGLTLDGAMDGVLWYVTPDFTKLANPQVWLEAAIQVFYSLGPTYGGVITMASHNRFKQKSVVETVICVSSDAFTAFYAGLVVFACLGFMAKESGVSVEEVAKASGPGLAFVAYPEAITRMPLPQLWAVLFFLTLITVAFDSCFGMLETVTGTLNDLYPRLLVKYRAYKYATLIGSATLLFLLSTPISMNGGIYLFQLSDWYISSFALLFGSALECIMVCWIYGADRFAKDIELMTGRKSSKMLRIVWCVIMTGFLSIGFICTLTSYQAPEYSGTYKYKPWAIKLGLGIAFIPFIPVVAMMIKEIYQAEGPILKRISHLLKPSAKWGPHDAQASEIYKAKPYQYENTLIKRIKTNMLGDKETPWF